MARYTEDTRSTTNTFQGREMKAVHGETRPSNPRNCDYKEPPDQLLDLFEKHVKLDRALTSAIENVRELIVKFAEAEKEYNRVYAKAMLTEAKGETIKAKEISVNHLLENARFDLTIAEGMKQVEIQNIMSLRQQISALQTLSKAYTEEFNSVKYGQTGGV